MTDPKKSPVDQINEAMKTVAMNPSVMAQAAKLTNLSYAFHFAQHARPVAEIVPLSEISAYLLELHNKQALIVSVSAFLNHNTKKMDTLVTYYAVKE